MKAIRLVCEACGVKSKPVIPTSPAAPVLTALEILHEEEGWSYQIGFFTMLTGDHHPRCKECSQKGEEDA